jgi:choline dehydrogenase-like flavoprotein
MPKSTHYSVVIIGTGFGGTMTGLPLARKLKERGRSENILMLERGTWWTTPVGTVQDKEVATYTFLQGKNQPVQFWSTPNSFSGVIDMFTRCFRRKWNEDGLYDFALLGRRLLGIFNLENDGVSILRASGVGGGSLVYSNITLRPPELIFNDKRWPSGWTLQQRNEYYELARDAIGTGVLWALDQRNLRQGNTTPPAVAGKKVNTGLSNIVTRSSDLAPHWIVDPDPNNPRRGVKRIDLTRTPPAEDAENRLWIDRARLFQESMDELKKKPMDVNYGAVDLAINDFDPAKAPINPAVPTVLSNQFDAQGTAKNYCERQGRCNVGCLPGARHTLNKQLMAAAVGTPNTSLINPGAAPAPPDFDNLEIEPLSEVDVVVAKPSGYEIKYVKRDKDKPWRTTQHSLTADIVIVSAGCLGTNEILLRSKKKDGLQNLSDKLGFGFSTNGDYLAFLDGTKKRMRLTRGPVTTSFGHFNASTEKNNLTFHTMEDQGVPPATASLVGMGTALLKSFAKGHRPLRFAVFTILCFLWKKAVHLAGALFNNFSKRQDIFQSDDEMLAKTLAIAVNGQDEALGQFRLGGGLGETPLRVKRVDKKPFHRDPIFHEIRKSLAALASVIAEKPGTKFENPFLSSLSGDLKSKSIVLSHPLGGCRISENVAEGVVDEFGRVFDKSKGPTGVYKGLYVADASIIPTALGINPSLTISALSLRIVDNLINKDLPVLLP